jgi:NAD dependent epimerase/dehydratase family enzyme
MLDSHRAHPVALLEKGFAFQFASIDAALSSLIDE